MQSIKVENVHAACLEERDIYNGYNKPMNQRRGRYNSARSSPNTIRFSRLTSRINRGAGRLAIPWMKMVMSADVQCVTV